MHETIYNINGRIVPEDQAVIPVTDRGFLYGDGVFETLHAYGSKLFRQKEHLRRLQHGMESLYFNPMPDLKQIETWLKQTISAANFTEANVRLTVTRGSGPRGPSIIGDYTPTILITVTRYLRPSVERNQRGVRAIVSTIRRQETAVTAHLKTLNYIEQILARREADLAPAVTLTGYSAPIGADEALLLNNAGLLCEGSASNISLISEGTLRVPDPERAGALPGIAQLTAMEAAESLKIPVVVTALSPWDPIRSDEAFLTGSIREITPLVCLGESLIGNGKPGPLTLDIAREYRRIVERECKPFRYSDTV